MQISVSDAKGQLTELVRRAEAGDEVVLTRHGRPAARIVAIRPKPIAPAARRALMDAIRAEASRRAVQGPDAARSQDFLYDGDGLPK
jgi:prevent-host-death family protein